MTFDLLTTKQPEPVFVHTLIFSCFSSSQVFLDVVESVNILVNSNGQIIRSEVVGALKMRTFLRCKLLIFQQSYTH